MLRVVNFLAVAIFIATASASNIKSYSAPISDAPSIAVSEVNPIASVEVTERSVDPIVDTPKLAEVPRRNTCDRIVINGKQICLFTTNSLAVDAGNKVAIYGDNFYFGHNSGAVFASLPSASSFQVIRGGNTTNYTIIRKGIFCDYSNDSHPCSNYPNDPILNMAKVLSPVRTIGNPTAISLMTCAGESIGGGDATHRFVAYAIAQ